jgi:hypothetical protein
LKWRAITKQSMPWRRYKCRAVQLKPQPTQPLPKPHLQRQPLLPLRLPLLQLLQLQSLQLTPRSKQYPVQPAMRSNIAWRVFSL